jgi:hypothetical protein
MTAQQWAKHDGFVFITALFDTLHAPPPSLVDYSSKIIMSQFNLYLTSCLILSARMACLLTLTLTVTLCCPFESNLTQSSR